MAKRADVADRREPKPTMPAKNLDVVACAC